MAASINALFGLVVAWVLVRYSFPGRRIIDSLVDLPFALPTAVAGITLTTLCAPNGWIGQLFEPYGIKIAFTRVGVTIAMVFIGLPFVVRTLQPVIEDLDAEIEEAAPSRRHRSRYGPVSGRNSTSVATDALALDALVGRVRSVVLSPQHAMRTEISAVLITKLEQFD